MNGKLQSRQTHHRYVQALSDRRRAYVTRSPLREGLSPLFSASMRRPTVSMLRHLFLHYVPVSAFILCSRPPPRFHPHSW